MAILGYPHQDEYLNNYIIDNTQKTEAGVQSLLINEHMEEFSYKKCNGVMGVPISFLDKHCSEQFEIIGATVDDAYPKSLRLHLDDYYNGYVWFCGKNKDKTHRVSSWMPLISDATKGGTLCKKNGYPDLFQHYHRIFIKIKQSHINNK